MSISELSKINVGLDELSLRKYLPLRQIRKKPLLQCGNRVFKVSVVDNSHITWGKNSKGTFHYEIQNPLVRSIGRSFDQNDSIDLANLHTKAETDLYSRPLSAQELAVELSFQNPPQKFPSSSHIAMNKHGLPSSLELNYMQLNSFLRPQNMIVQLPKHDILMKMPLRRERTIARSAGDCEIHKDNKTAICPRQNSFLFSVPSIDSSVRPKTELLGSKDFLLPLKQVLLPSHDQQSYQKADDVYPRQDQLSLKQEHFSRKNPLPIPKHMSSIPKVGSNTSKGFCARNLNYTPAKPYSEVQNLNQESLDIKNALAHRSDMKLKNCCDTSSLVASSETTTKACMAFYKKVTKLEKQIVGAKSLVADKTTMTMMCEKSQKQYDQTEPEVDTTLGVAFKNFQRGKEPTDGETSDDEDDGSEDEVFEENLSDFDDDQTFSSFSTRRSGSSVCVKSAPKSTQKVLPALTQSIFANIPPTINFVIEGYRVESLALDLKQLLRWRMSPITPNIVKSTLARVGFKVTKSKFQNHYKLLHEVECHDWLGCWGKHMKAQAFLSIREYQKLNHFPGSFQIGRKDRLWRNLSKLQGQFGKKEYGFFPQTFVLPADIKMFKRTWESGGNRHKWIIKPPASARGNGVKVVYRWTQIPKRRPIIVQKYISRPYLINGSKFDIRLYVYVSCFDPLRVYLFEDGLARFASCKYSTSTKTLTNRCMHLTNYSINKYNPDYKSNSSELSCQGHKWSLKALWCYLKKQGINTQYLWDTIKDVVIKTIIGGESMVTSSIRANVHSRYCVHELFGFDILLDENLKPWILEVNISPSLHSNSTLDVNIKGPMVRDVLNLAGFRIPDKADLTVHPPVISDNSKYVPPNVHCLDKRLYSKSLSTDEKLKHSYYCQHCLDAQTMRTILDILTPDDLRILTETLDEESRRGGFQRIFPSSVSHKYLKYFEQPHYYSLLLDQWVHRYLKLEMRGLALIRSYCEQSIHLLNPTNNIKHQWSPPIITLPRELQVASPMSVYRSSKETKDPQSHQNEVLRIKPTGKAYFQNCNPDKMNGKVSVPLSSWATGQRNLDR